MDWSDFLDGYRGFNYGRLTPTPRQMDTSLSDSRSQEAKRTAEDAEDRLARYALLFHAMLTLC